MMLSLQCQCKIILCKKEELDMIMRSFARSWEVGCGLKVQSVG